MARDAVNATGGARIGLRNWTWPLASLSACQDELLLGVRSLGPHRFTPAQVVSIETFVLIPIIAWGIRIRHVVRKYPEMLVFWCFSSPYELRRQILETGFNPNADSDSTPHHPGVCLRWQAVLVFVGLCSALLMYGLHLWWLLMAAIGLMAAVMFAAGRFRWAEHCLLTEDRIRSEVWPLLVLFAVVAVLIAVAMLTS